MSKMAEVHAEVTNRVKNCYGMLTDCMSIVEDEWEGDGSELKLNKDQAAELEDDLWYMYQVFRHDILPWLNIETDSKCHLIKED